MATRSQSRSRATRKIFSDIGNTITNIIAAPYRVLTRRRTLVHPYESSPRSSPINKNIKLKPKHTHLDKISEESDDEDMSTIKLNIWGNGKKNATVAKKNKRNNKMK